MSKLKNIGKHQDDDMYAFKCPGCKGGHILYVPRWTWNGSLDKPTATPSLKVTAPPSDYCCHFFITDGKLHYCGDCSHELKGQVVEMPEYPE